METMSAFQLQLKSSEVYRSMGTGVSTQKINKNLLEKIEQYRPQALELLSCEYTYKIVPINKLTETQVLINNSLSLSCNTRYFQGASEVAIILLTVGPAIENEIKRFVANSFLLDGFILDAYANTALDEFFGFIRSQLEEEQSKSQLQLGYSLSPGCILDVEAQETVFSILETEVQEMSIFLRDSYAMFPGKSCSYCIPIGKNLTMSSQSRYACPICPSHNSCQFSPIGKAK